HHDALLGVAEDLLDVLTEVALVDDEPGLLCVGGVRQQQVDALVTEPGEPCQVGQTAIQRQLVHLEVAGVQHGAARGTDPHGQRVVDGVVDREELQVEGAEALPLSFFDLDRGRLDAVLAQLGGQERQCEPGTDERDVGALTQQERHTTDVVLVPMGEHDRLDVVESVPDVVEVRQDQVGAGLFLLGEEHTAVDDEQPAVVLEDGHVATDLAKTAQGDHAQGALPQGWWRGQSGMRVAHTDPSARRSTWTALAGTAWCGARPMGPLTPAAARSSRRSACSSEEASANGVRTGPEGRPNRFSTALTVMTP